jgi:phosphoribosylaminoimidazole (AIR) synthetase
MIENAKIKANRPIVGLGELGYRCNGGSALVNLALRAFGTPKRMLKNREAMGFVQALTQPSVSYAKLIARIVGWNPDGTVGGKLARIDGAAHITGGGVWGKFGEILPPGVGAVLDNMPYPPTVLLQAQSLSHAHQMPWSDTKCYDTFHGGCGMLLVAHSDQEAQVIIDEATRDGIAAQVVGHTIESDTEELTITSRFTQQTGEVLTSPLR